MAAKKQAAVLASCRSLPNSPSHSGGSTPVSGVFPGQVRQSWTLVPSFIQVYCVFSAWLFLLLFIHYPLPILLLLFLLFRPVTVVRAVITPHHFHPHLWSAIKRLAGQLKGKNRKVPRLGQSAVPPGDAPPDLRYILIKTVCCLVFRFVYILQGSHI